MRFAFATSDFKTQPHRGTAISDARQRGAESAMLTEIRKQPAARITLFIMVNLEVSEAFAPASFARSTIATTAVSSLTEHYLRYILKIADPAPQIIRRPITLGSPTAF
jgi:hypothetical protein